MSSPIKPVPDGPKKDKPAKDQAKDAGSKVRSVPPKPDSGTPPARTGLRVLPTADAAQPSRTPRHPGELPAFDAEEPVDVKAPGLLLNRELTWLNFNYRVLHEAADERTPLLERAKFLSIVSSNLDEFFMKRIGGLKQQVGAGLHDLTVDGRTPQQQIDECYDVVRDIESEKRRVFVEVDRLLVQRGIRLTSFEDVSKKDQQKLREDYLENIYPLVTPQVSDPAHPFPFISNLSTNLLVTVRHPDDDDQSRARVKVPVGPGIPRFMKLEGQNTYVTLESVMASNLDLLFPEMIVENCEMFRVTRNANTELDEERADDLLAMIETELRERRFAPIVRLEVARGMIPLHRGMLAAELGLDEQADVFEVEGFMAMRDLMQIIDADDAADLHDPPHHPIDHPELQSDRNIFHVIRDVGSIVLHHPYESFTTSIERFLREASHDPKVLALKMTLYRTSAESRAVQFLIDAARNGKQVTVVVELKARFDEEANIRWANRLEHAGVHVTYGVVGLKTHCKAILVVRRDFSGLRRYAHIGTGNYHAGTARLYTDLGLLTSDEAIGKDLTELFNYLTTGFKPKRKFNKILPAPKVLKPQLLEKIEREILGHTKKSPGLIRFKINALEDVDVTEALYRASQAGVQIDLIVRDSCRLRPGIPNLSENVRVLSIVGRFLEHARVLYFRNGGDEEYFIGSADCMKRNLNSRVEVYAPVEAAPLREKLRELLELQLNDQRSAWEMQPDGSYVQRLPQTKKEARSSQEMTIEWSEKRLKEATRLRRRKPSAIKRPRPR
jgi:polyphosphate kinase